MLAACLSGMSVGLLAGFLKIWLPLLFLLAGTGFAGALATAFGPSLLGFLDSENTQLAAAFLVVFAAMQVMGAVVHTLMSYPLTVASAMVSLVPMGALLNRAGGILAGLLYGCVFLSVILIALQQVPVDSIAEGMDESSYAHRPIGWVDRYVASIEIAAD